MSDILTKIDLFAFLVTFVMSSDILLNVYKKITENFLKLHVYVDLVYLYEMLTDILSVSWTALHFLMRHDSLT